MKFLSSIFIFGIIFFISCSPKTNDGITPTQPAYTGTGLPNPLVLYNGTLAAGAAFDPIVDEGSPYDAALTINFDDTSVKPASGFANMIFGVTNYSISNNPGSNFAAFIVEPTFTTPTATTVDLSSGGYTTASFYARGDFAPGVTTALVNFTVCGTAYNNESLTGSWQKFSLALPGSLTTISQYFVVGMSIPNDKAPFLVFIDQLQFQ